MPSALDQLQQIQRGEFPAPPVADLIGFTLTSVEPGRVVKAGRTVGLVECDVTDEQASLVARATSTCMTLRGEQAAGR